MSEAIDLLVTGASEIVTMAGSAAPRRGAEMSELGLVRHGAVAIDGGRILAVASQGELEASYAPRERLDAGGGVVLPGFVDSHTHPVFAATRQDEFAMRLAGRDYMEIAAAGGGIHASVRKLRELSEDELLRRTKARLAGFVPLGTTTVECKSGYGLSMADELKSLRVIARAARESALDIVPTFLGAHEIPLERRDDRRRYIREVIEEMTPAVAEEGLAIFSDVFCEQGVFTRDEAIEVLEAGKAHGLIPKVHADELATSGGSEAAAAVGAISADHLVMVGPAQIEALRGAGVIATLLPGTIFHLGKTRFAPARALIEAGVPVALATDFNPGTSMTRSMGMILTLAMIRLKMTAAEALCAATHNGACAVGLSEELGRLQAGLKADVVVHSVDSYDVLPYHYGESHVTAVIKDGRIVYRR